MSQVSTNDTDQTNLEVVKEAMENFVKYCQENSLTDDEKVDYSLNFDDQSKVSTISYTSPEGSFNIKYNPKKKSATATVDWVTGAFKSTVTDVEKKTTGTGPVYHDRWGLLHQAFSSSDDY